MAEWWEYTRGWLVQTDDKTDRESVVSTATGLPAYGELHPSPISDAAYCNQIAYTMTDRGGHADRVDRYGKLHISEKP